MTRVLHCIYDDPGNPWVGGGGALRVWEIYRRLTGDVTATVASGNYPGAVDETRDAVEYVRLGAEAPYPWSRWTYARAATRLLARGDYDVGILDFSAYTPVRVPRNRPVGLVVHMLHGPTAPARWGRPAGALLASDERRRIASWPWISTTSRWMKQRIERFAPDSRVVVVSSGVSPEFFANPRTEGDYLLFYGRFDFFQKGLDTLLEAFAAIRREFPASRLVLAGRGKDAELVRRRIGEMGMADRIEVREGVGRAEVLSLFSGAIAMVMPSRLEGLPMAPAEAMAAGVPVIASDVGAVEELLGMPSGGILIPPEDAAALARAISSLLTRPGRREEISRAARRAAERFSWDHVAREHLDFLRMIAAGGGRPFITSEKERT